MMVPNAFNSVMRPDQLMCVCFDVDPDFGGDGMYTVMVIARPAINIAWNYFGNVWMSTWPPSQPIPEWYTYVMGIANMRVNEVVGEPSTPPVAVCPPVPATTDFETVKAWFIQNVKWETTAIGGWNLVPGQQGQPPVDPPSVADGAFPLYVSRVFAGRHAFEYGVNADGTPAVRVNEWGKGWEDYVPK